MVSPSTLQPNYSSLSSTSSFSDVDHNGNVLAMLFSIDFGDSWLLIFYLDMYIVIIFLNYWILSYLFLKSNKLFIFPKCNCFLVYPLVTLFLSSVSMIYLLPRLVLKTRWFKIQEALSIAINCYYILLYFPHYLNFCYTHLF